ncbi:copper amine oxidase [Paenibacillus sp. FSL R5-0517]|uniref:copper amine oxidase n=1 Tax=Paenibacillus sp. FSL R5-0517 TaxID=2921647 RepID=UPI0030DC7763
MKKVAYIAGGVLIGLVVSTAGGAFADTVKSLVGKKVTGEYTVTVDGKRLTDKGAVIDSKANVPARALSEALGAEVKVEGKNIFITSSPENSNITSQSDVVNSDNKYMKDTKSSLEALKESTVNRVLEPLMESRAQVAKWLEESEEQNNQLAVEGWSKQLKEYDADIAKHNAELKLIEEALATK